MSFPKIPRPYREHSRFTAPLEPKLKFMARKGSVFDRWKGFYSLAGLCTVLILLPLPLMEGSALERAAAMIRQSARVSVALFLFAFSARAAAALWPGRVTRWLHGNRKHLGLAFAVGMTWQLVFIAWSISVDQVRFANNFLTPSLSIGVVAYLLILAMTITSFDGLAKRLGGRNWRRLHRFGMYYLWLVIASTYSYNALYYDEPHPALSVFGFLVCFAAYSVRVAAWLKKVSSAAVARVA
jgi:sulfoxide reductase heme-binding subunit YedZ